MENNLTAWLIFCACGALLCLVWYYFADRRAASDGRSLPRVLLTGLLAILLGAALARLVWVLCQISYRPPLLRMKLEELSYYGGVAGVLLAVALAARITNRSGRLALNTFAPMGALLAAVFRFAEGFLGFLGLGAWRETGLFFPLTVEVAWTEDYSDFFWAVFMLEGLFSLIAMVLALRHPEEKYRWVRTLFYLCLPQIFCESLRTTSIRWLFVRSEQLFCFLLCEGVLIWYALRNVRAGQQKLRAWSAPLWGLVVCGLVVVAEFALDGKIAFGNHLIPHGLIYAVMVLALASLAVAEHRARPAGD